MHDRRLFRPERASMLDDPDRVKTQIGESELADLLALKGQEDLADLGSGTGFYTDRIARLTKGTVYAVELQPEMLAMHRIKRPPKNVRLVQADVNDLPLLPGSIDVAYSIVTFHETYDPRGMCRILSAMRPGGRLIVIDWRRDPASDAQGPPLTLRYTKEEVETLLSPWFRTERAEDVGQFLFAVVGRRRERPLS
jgi:ubiquinone/menaquinone biosynthesis C-methylase UbiE